MLVFYTRLCPVPTFRIAGNQKKQTKGVRINFFEKRLWQSLPLEWPSRVVFMKPTASVDS